MDDQRLGSLLRALRIKRGLRQIDVAVLAGVSDVTVSRIERGQLATLSLGALRRVARVLEVRLDLSAWSRSGDIERIASSRHSALVDALIRELAKARWRARPEVSFNHNGERGLVDIAAWHPATRTLLFVEVKTEIVDVGETVGTFDRKRRLAATIARSLGLEPTSYSCAIVIADTRTNHRRVMEHRATFRAAFPGSGRGFRAFIRAPTGTIAAIAFWPLRQPGTARQISGGTRRVRRPSAPTFRSLRRSNKLEAMAGPRTVLRQERN
jgi:transcriptional regulator with XRE-family HTH domain